MITIYVHRNGRTERATSVDRGWLNPSAGVFVWVDLASPSVPEALVLSETFAFHPLAVEDAMSQLQYPKVEPYDGYLYVVLHGLDFQSAAKGFATHDVDFFLGRNFLVTVHDGYSRSVTELRDHCPRDANILGDGPVALFHRIVDKMVDRYLPELDQFEDVLERLEDDVFTRPSPALLREIIRLKQDVAGLRRIAGPQRDAVNRLARREFVDISTEMAFRFRDVYDQLVRLNDSALLFHDRISSLLDAHLASVSNRLNEVMKVLTVVATIFMPLTLLSGLWGMNVELPLLPGSAAAQFWWLSGLMAVVVTGMLAFFRFRRWI